jgi:hypothetical protein
VGPNQHSGVGAERCQGHKPAPLGTAKAQCPNIARTHNHDLAEHGITRALPLKESWGSSPTALEPEPDACQNQTHPKGNNLPQRVMMTQGRTQVPQQGGGLPPHGNSNQQCSHWLQSVPMHRTTNQKVPTRVKRELGQPITLPEGGACPQKQERPRNGNGHAKIPTKTKHAHYAPERGLVPARS